MKRIRGWSLFLAAGLLVALAGFALATYFIPRHDEVPDNTIRIDSEGTISLAITGDPWSHLGVKPGQRLGDQFDLVNTSAVTMRTTIASTHSIPAVSDAIQVVVDDQTWGVPCRAATAMIEADGTPNPIGATIYSGALTGFGGSVLIGAGALGGNHLCFGFVLPTWVSAIAGLENLTTLTFDTVQA